MDFLLHDNSNQPLEVLEMFHYKGVLGHAWTHPPKRGVGFWWLVRSVMGATGKWCICARIAVPDLNIKESWGMGGEEIIQLAPLSWVIKTLPPCFLLSSLSHIDSASLSFLPYLKYLPLWTPTHPFRFNSRPTFHEAIPDNFQSSLSCIWLRHQLQVHKTVLWNSEHVYSQKGYISVELRFL